MKEFFILSFLSISVMFGTETVAGSASATASTGDATPPLAAVAASSGPDYSTHFESAKQQQVHFENKGSQPVAFDVMAAVTFFLDPNSGDLTLCNEWYCNQKKQTIRMPDGAIPKSGNYPFVKKDATKNPLSKRVALQPGESITLNVKDINVSAARDKTPVNHLTAHMSYFLGLKNLTGMTDYLAWDVNEKGLSVLLGVDEGMYTLRKMGPIYSKVIYDAASILYQMTKQTVDSRNRMISKFVKQKEQELVPDNAPYIIPAITHRIWITFSSDAKEVPINRLEHYRNSLSFYTNKPYRHIFWCIDPDKIPETIKIIRNFPILVEIRSINAVLDIFICKSLLSKLLRDKVGGFASNIIRKEILYIFGGCYCDIGLQQLTDIDEKLKKTSKLLYIKPCGEIDVCLMGFSKNNSFLLKNLNLINSLPNQSEEFKSIPIPRECMQCLTTSYSIMFQLLNENLDLLFILENKDFKYQGMQLWKTIPQFQVLQVNPNYFFEE